jgi:hypothetical protein
MKVKGLNKRGGRHRLGSTGNRLKLVNSLYGNLINTY